MGRQILTKKTKHFFRLLYALLILWASSVYADEMAELKGPFQRGATEWGLCIGFANNFHVGGDVRENIQFYSLSPSWGKVLKEWERSKSLEFLMEGSLAYSRQDSAGRYAVGITPLFLYNFQPITKIVLSFELGAGILYTNLDPERFGSHFNFTPQGGIGLGYELARGTFLKISYRFHHISNAGLSEENRGINSHLFSVGLSLFH
jgi:lipid A 3-O-deacylase